MKNIKDIIIEVVLRNIVLIVLSVLYSVSLFVTSHYQPWEGSSFQEEFGDVIAKTGEKSAETLLPALSTLFNGFLNAVACAVAGAAKAGEGSSYNFILMLILSCLYFTLMACAGLLINQELFGEDGLTPGKIKGSAGGQMLDNIWFTLSAYIWWFVSLAAKAHPKATMIIIVLLIIVAYRYIRAGVLVAAGFLLLLFGSVYLSVHICARLPEYTILRVAALTVMILVIRGILNLAAYFIIEEYGY